MLIFTIKLEKKINNYKKKCKKSKIFTIISLMLNFIMIDKR